MGCAATLGNIPPPRVACGSEETQLTAALLANVRHLDGVEAVGQVFHACHAVTARYADQPL